MAENLNNTVLMGRLTRDPEQKTTTSGTELTTFTLAVNGRGEDTMFMDVVLFGKTAEVAAKWLTKGRQAIVEGRLNQRRWDDKDGNKRSTIELSGNRLYFINDGTQNSGGNTQSRDTAPRDDEVDEPIDLSEIPF